MARIDALKDEAIDTSDIAPLDKSFFAKAHLRMPTRKATITMRIDADVLNWFRLQGKRYQSRMNAVLRMYVEAHRR